MNNAIQKMLKTPGTHYVTDPGQLKPREPGKAPTQQCLPVWVDEKGKVFQLHKGNQLGQEVDPKIFRADSLVLRQRLGNRKLG